MLHLFDALRDLAELTLGCSARRRMGEGVPDPVGAQMGGLVYLWSESAALHVGVLAAPLACQVLAGRLLGKPEEMTLSHPLVRGAMCELAYLLAGGVKRRLAGCGALSVGQPCFLEGTIQPRPGWQVEATEVELDGIPATLVCMTRAPF
jgi:hypothetical protein